MRRAGKGRREGREGREGRREGGRRMVKKEES